MNCARLYSAVLAMVAVMHVVCPQVWADAKAGPVVEPRVVGVAPANEGDLVKLPDGTLKFFYTSMEHERVESISSADHGRTWQPAVVEFSTNGRTHHACEVMIDRDGELHVFYLYKRGKGKINVDYFIDVHHRKTVAGAKQWSEPVTIFQGYTGALRGAVQLPSGRLVVPIGVWAGEDPQRRPGTGKNYIDVVYSDDNGQTWQRSPVQLTSPIYEGYNGSNYGAVEPSLVLLPTGQLWMLYRTQAGHLYESYSSDGVSWSAGVASRFVSSNSPAAPLVLDDGRVVLFWNNCEMPARYQGDGVYGGRDALHAAISNQARTQWFGFREVYRDPTRHVTPPRRGDRGTAYPNAVLTDAGHILLVTGQGEHVRRFILLSQSWLEQSKQSDDIADGVAQWTAFRSFGPAVRWWRDRTLGVEVLSHPDKQGGSVLHLKSDGKEVAGAAVWNFPIGIAGEVKLRLKLAEDFAGGRIALADRFYDPADPAGDARAMFVLQVEQDGQSVFRKGEWMELTLAWDLATEQCEVHVDGKKVEQAIMLNKPTENGISYLRLSVIGDSAHGGLLVDSVTATLSQQGTLVAGE